MNLFVKISISLVLFVFITAFSDSANTYSINGDPLNNDLSTLFSGSGNCTVCHKSTSNANTSQTYGSVSPLDLWQATMMANAARDPLWQAKVSTEVAQFPQHKQLIEDTCTKCHAPMGRTQKIYDDSTSQYSFDEMNADGLALDGVSCTACHQIKDELLGTGESYNGNYVIGDEKLIYGPYTPEYSFHMEIVTGYSPEYSKHISESEMCATCHTLITQTLDDNGNVIGEFFEQTSYLEWKNSVFEDANIECQTCHMPALAEPIRMSATPPFILARDTVHLHELVGANTFMLNLLKDNSEALGATFTNEAIDSTLKRTKEMLIGQTVDVSITTDVVYDSLVVKIKLQNKAGHKFPTGYPARRSWLNVAVHHNDNVLFESGEYDADGRISDEDETYEPHYDVITKDDQAQIYEQVMGDVNKNVTYTLLKAFDQLKDNRLTPIGFTKSDETYDTVAIKGVADVDDNFNFNNGMEGSGSDEVTYKVALNGINGSLIVDVKLLYQSVNPKFSDHMFSFATEAVNKFQPMFDLAEKTPFVVFDTTIVPVVASTLVSEGAPEEFALHQNYPNPFNPATTIKYSVPFNVKTQRVVSLRIYDSLGKEITVLVNEIQSAGLYQVAWNAENYSSGVYYYTLSVGENQITKKMLFIK